MDVSKPDVSQESKKLTSDTTNQQQQCPSYLLSGSEDGSIRLWDLSNKGAIRYHLEQDAGISCMMLSQLKGKNIRNTIYLIHIYILNTFCYK